MPTYDYECRACGAELEMFQSITESPKRKCPECGALKLVRKIGTGAGILFKGSGFYQTDYRSDSYKQAAKADEPSSPPKGESKGPSKPGASKDGSPAGKPGEKKDTGTKKKDD
jgi:putative FmdB family regulatory protein